MDPRVHPDFQKLSHLSLPMHTTSLMATNQFLRSYRKAVHPLPGTVMTLRRAVSRDGTLIPLRLFSPEKQEQSGACLIYFHGGAFVLTAAPYHYKLANLYAQQANCTVVMVDYRLAPQHPFPQGLEDCFSALEWVHHNAALLGIDHRRIAVGGDSAGGNLAAVTALLARDEGTLPLCGQMLIYPVTDVRMETPSMQEFPDSPVWNSRLTAKMWQMYLPHPVRRPWQVSPIEAPALEDLPDTYLETAEVDCLRDEGIAYGQSLLRAGNAVTLHQTKGTIHAFDMELHSTIVQSCIAERVAWLRDRFTLSENQE
ncbi:MAG: alpha/beta hydrolase [Oscillospiraceae bacterium]|nr:alpha/beta hydrolase [Oscillospiraceae bacterium]